MIFKARGTLDSGENFSFTVDAPNFVVASSMASNTMQSKLAGRAGAVVSFNMKFMDGDEGFKIRKSDKKEKVAPGPVPDAPIPATASMAAKTAVKK